MQFIKDLQSDLISVKLDHQEESLVKRANHLYSVSNANSKTEINDEIYNLTQIYITPPIHEGQHDYELVCVYSGNKRALFTFFLKKDTTPVLTFPSEHIDLAILDSYIHTNFHYNNDSREHIFVCTTPIPINDSSIEIHGNPSRLYKQIYEPTIFSQLSFLFTQKDSAKQIVILHENISIQKGRIEKIQEGFHTDGEPTETYMQCELVDDDDIHVEKAEYALTPLNANEYERGMITFVTFLHILLVVLGGGVFLPFVFCNLNFFKCDQPWAIFGTVLHLGFFIVAVILISMGIHNKPLKIKTGGKAPDKKVLAAVGFYFLVMFFANAIGMMTMFPDTEMYSEERLLPNQDSKLRYLVSLFVPFNGVNWNDNGK